MRVSANDRQAVSSQIIRSVGYFHSDAIMEIEFRNGWIYHYYNVPEPVFIALLAAPSHGKYLKRQIVNQYVTRRIR